MTRSTTPWKYIIHKRDGIVTRLRKRIGRFAWKRKLVRQ